MKNIICFLLFISSLMGYAQNNYIVKTDDGRRVLLKADYTWEYIDQVAPSQTNTPTTSPVPQVVVASEVRKDDCELPLGFEEPKLNTRVQAQLKKGRATIKHLKSRVAKDQKCAPEEVLLISFRETVQKGTYTLCANNKKVQYKRLGNSFSKRIQISL